mmetsp:Transcript_41453/g.120016  ORF Transcript_41453/g.120016 Transcript_41453/m.120016 type:complete len:238 (-) Transcript_41453:2881-3594(-)
MVGHEVHFPLHELRQLSGILLFDQDFQERRLANPRSADELDVDIAVRPGTWDTSPHHARPRHAGAHVHAGGRLHCCALEELLVPALRVLALLLLRLRIRSGLLDFRPNARELLVPLLDVFLHRLHLLGLHNLLRGVRGELGGLRGFLLDLGEVLLHAFDALLQLPDPAGQRLLLALQLQLDCLQLLVPPAQLRCLLRGFLGLCHEGANLLGFLLQLLHLLLRRHKPNPLLREGDGGA